MKMSLNNLIIEQLSKLSLIPKKHTDTKNHLFADFFELVTLFNKDEVSINEILDKYRKEGISVPIANRTEENEIGSMKSEINDLEELWADEIFQICLERERILNEDYPFNLHKTILSLKENLDDKQKIYLLLLFASNLNYFPYFESYFTTDFEFISYQSLKAFMPPHAIIKQFGKNSDYDGTAKEKILALGKDLNVKISIEEIDNNVRGNQERGLDVIGWIPFQDKTPNFVSILGQCACGKDWYKKQTETRRYEKAYYQFYKTTPIHTMFIPYALATGNSSFYQSDEIDCLLFERFRILDYVNETDFFKSLASKKIVESCIDPFKN